MSTVQSAQPAFDASLNGREPASWPSVSVVVPTRDRPELLRQTIDAILAQDYPATVRCIVVYDRAEPDHTLERADAMRAVSVMTNTRSPGLAGGRNTGISAADTELVAFCDDDDVWLPGKLSAQVRALESCPESAMACCGITVLYDGAAVDRTAGSEQVLLHDLLGSRMTGTHPSSFLLRRDRFVDSIGLVDEDIPGSYAEDYEFLLRAAKHGPIVNVDAPLVRVLWHKKSYFESQWQTITTALSWLLERYPEFQGHPRGMARITGQIAFAEAAQGHRRAALRWALRTLRRDPRQLRAYLALVVAGRVASADGIVRALHKRGRGI